MEDNRANAGAMEEGRERYRLVRSVLEAPVLDPRKWAKLPSIPCDAVLIDMEDSVPLGMKPEGRAAVLAAIAERDQFGDRVVIGRPNHLATPWGYDDIVGLARAGAPAVMYPKVRSADDVRQLQRLLREEGADPDLVICIETPQAVANVEEIARVDRVVAFAFGEGDLTADMGIPIHLDDGAPNPAILPARMRVSIAAAAADIAMFDFAVLRDIRDVEEYRRRAIDLLACGASGFCTIYPPHVYVANELLTPTAEQVDRASEIVEAFVSAQESGQPAVQLEGGRTVLIHDFTKARRVLARAGRS